MLLDTCSTVQVDPSYSDQLSQRKPKHVHDRHNQNNIFFNPSNLHVSVRAGPSSVSAQLYKIVF